MSNVDKKARELARIVNSDPENINAHKRKQLDECRLTGKRLVSRTVDMFSVRERYDRAIGKYTNHNFNVLNQTLGKISLHDFVELAKSKTKEVDIREIGFQVAPNDAVATLQLRFKTVETDDELKFRLNQEAMARKDAESKLKSALRLARKAGLKEEEIKDMLA